MIIQGDCREVMAGMEPNSVDAIVCDPPYDLTANKKGGSGVASVDLSTPYGRSRITVGNGAGGFMGKSWDGTGVAFDPATWAEALRVLKPGGFLLAFGGDRTIHRMITAIEDAGFEIRTQLVWLAGSGFSKSWNFNTRYKGEWCDCPDSGNALEYNHGYTNENDQSNGDLRDLREGVSEAPILGQTDKDALLFLLLQRQGTGEDAGRPLGQHEGAQAERPSLWTGQSVMEGRAVHRAGQGLRDDPQPGSSPSADQRLRFGAHSGSGTDARATAISGRGSPSSQSGPGGQSTGEPTDLRDPQRTLDDGTLRDGGLCSRCGKLSTFYKGAGTGLKPAMELICMARKPLSEPNVAANCLKWGTGAINVDGCRLDGVPPSVPQSAIRPNGIDRGHALGTGKGRNGEMSQSTAGRWPPNVAMDEAAARLLDAMSGERNSRDGKTTSNRNEIYGKFTGEYDKTMYDDTGGASRFMKVVAQDDPATRFLYCPKASRAERNAGLEGMPERDWPEEHTGHESRQCRTCGGWYPKPMREERRPGSTCVCDAPDWEKTGRNPQSNGHPTVKPLALCQWLVRMVTKPGGTVLDPFMGSGSTGVAAFREGFEFIGIEQDPDYCEIARARIAHAHKQGRQVEMDIA